MASDQVQATQLTTEQTQPPLETKITLQANDGRRFEVEKAVAMELGTVKTYFEDNSAVADNHNDITVPLPLVSSAALTRIITYCKKHVGFRQTSTSPQGETTHVFDEDEAGKKQASDAAIKAFDAEFIKEQSNVMLKELVLAANYLDVKGLLELLEESIADRIKNRSVEYVRRFFGIKNDFSFEEEKELREENSWAFEGVEED